MEKKFLLNIFIFILFFTFTKGKSERFTFIEIGNTKIEACKRNTDKWSIVHEGSFYDFSYNFKVYGTSYTIVFENGLRKTLSCKKGELISGFDQISHEYKRSYKFKSSVTNEFLHTHIENSEYRGGINKGVLNPNPMIFPAMHEILLNDTFSFIWEKSGSNNTVILYKDTVKQIFLDSLNFIDTSIVSSVFKNIRFLSGEVYFWGMRTSTEFNDFTIADNSTRNKINKEYSELEKIKLNDPELYYIKKADYQLIQHLYTEAWKTYLTAEKELPNSLIVKSEFSAFINQFNLYQD